MLETNKIIQGNCLDVIKTFPDKCIDCVITSPPYWQLRDYGWDGQWGKEKTFRMYLDNLWRLMDEIWRVLKDTGTVWINLGDTYNGSSKGNNNGTYGDVKQKAGVNEQEIIKSKGAEPNKCLLLIPHRFAIGCIDRGWTVRNDIIWAKRNGMPEPQTDRLSKKHEYIFLMTKTEKYYFDLDGIRDKNISTENKYVVTDSIQFEDLDVVEIAIEATTKIPQDSAESFGSPRARQHRKSNGKSVFGGKKGDGQDPDGIYSGKEWFPNEDGKNPGDVSDFWDIPTQPSSDEHFASYSDKLIGKPIVAGCPIGGIILDPFCGTATTGCRAIDLQRKFIGIEGKEEYVKIGNKKLLPFQITQQLF